VAPVVKSVRYWDKAASEGKNAYTVGVRMHLLKDNKWLIDDVVRGRWSTETGEEQRAIGNSGRKKPVGTIRVIFSDE